MASKFRSGIDVAYKKKVIGGLEKKVRQIALVLDSELVARTPVDTGRARSNWIPSLNSPSTAEVEANQKPPIENTLGEYKAEREDTIFISNNLPYIKKLNEGSSKQAPAGFVEDAVLVAKSVVK